MRARLYQHCACMVILLCTAVQHATCHAYFVLVVFMCIRPCEQDAAIYCQVFLPSGGELTSSCTCLVQDNMRVPVPVEWDSRHLVALLELGRVLREYLQGDGVSELPPVTVALMLAQAVPFLMQDGVLLRYTYILGT